MEFVKPGTNIDFISKRRLMLGISIAIIVAGIIATVLRGGLPMGIDFTGGTEVHVQFNQEVAAGDVRSAVEGLGLGETVVQGIGLQGDNEYLVRVAAVEVENAPSVAAVIEGSLDEKFGAGSYKVLREDLVGPRAGEDLRRQGLFAVILSFLGILIYVGFRFDFKFAAGAILALVHDTLVVLAFFAFFGKELNLTVIAAILTIIGFSINDTVVIYDRIRENMRLIRTKTFAEIVNASLNQTLGRSVLTSATLFVVSLILFFVGGSVLNDFAFTMIVGVVAGTYSSIYIAAPVVIDWHTRKGGTKGTPAKGHRKVKAAAKG